MSVRKYCLSSTLVWVFVILRDSMQVTCDRGLQSTRAGEEPSHQVEQPPAESTDGSETTNNKQKIIAKHFKKLKFRSSLRFCFFCFGSQAYCCVYLHFTVYGLQILGGAVIHNDNVNFFNLGHSKFCRSATIMQCFVPQQTILDIIF